MPCYARSSAFRSVNATAAASSPPPARNGAAAATRVDTSRLDHAGHTNARHPGRQPRASRAPDPNGAGSGSANWRCGRHHAANWRCGRHHAWKHMRSWDLRSRPVAPPACPSQHHRRRRNGSSNRAGEFEIQPRRGANELALMPCAGVSWRAARRPPAAADRRAPGATTGSGPSLPPRGSSPSSPSLKAASRVTFATPSRPDRRGALLRSTKFMAPHRGRVVSPSDRQMGDTEANKVHMRLVDCAKNDTSQQHQERDGNRTYRTLMMRQHICC